MKGYDMTNSHCARKLGGDGKGERENNFSPPPPYAPTSAHAREKEGERMESRARERGFTRDGREIHHAREKRERREIVEEREREKRERNRKRESDKRKTEVVECAILRIKQNLYSTLRN